MTLMPLIVTLLLPYNLNSAFDLLYVAWVPFGIKTGHQFFLSYIMQWITTIPLYTSFIGKILFINHVQREFQYQCEKLKYALRTTCDRVSKKVILRYPELNVEDNNNKDEKHYRELVNSSSGNNEFTFIKCNETELLKKLGECVCHYQQMQRYLL